MHSLIQWRATASRNVGILIDADPGCRSTEFEELSHTDDEVRLASASATRIHMHFVAAYFEMDVERLFPPELVAVNASQQFPGTFC